jgi:hypothetical protein
MKFLLVGAEFYVGRRTYGQIDRQTDVTKLGVAFRNFAKAPKTAFIIRLLWKPCSYRDKHLTACGRALVYKLTVAQPVKTILAFYRFRSWWSLLRMPSFLGPGLRMFPCLSFCCQNSCLEFLIASLLYDSPCFSSWYMHALFWVPVV